MALVNYKTTNNAETTLLGDISASATSIIVNTGEGDLFPSTFPFLLTLEQYNASGLAIKREIVKATARVDDTITITRAEETCVQNDTANPKTLTNNALSFASGDKVSIYNTAGNDKDLKDELVRLETDKANDSEVIHNTGDETGITGNKTFTGNITANAFIGDGSLLTGISSVVEATQSTAIAGENISAGDALALGYIKYSNNSFSVASQETTCTDVFLKNDGTKAYIIGTANDRVYQYSLSTAWDISTASYDSKSFSVNAQAGSPQGIFINSDGTKLYMTEGSTADTVYQYTMSTAWDISTASYDSISFSVASQASFPNSIFFKSDGTKLYVGCEITDKIYQYTLSTAWNISTASYDSKFISVASQDGTIRSVKISDDGLILYILGSTNDKIYQYTMSTAWDISTASYTGKSFSVATQETSPDGLFIGDSLSKAYIIGAGNNTIYEYDIIDGQAIKADASSSSLINFIGFANNTVTSGNTVTINTSGVDSNQSGLTIGSDYYLSDTAGALSTTPGTNSVRVGKAISATEILIDTERNDLLEGATSTTATTGAVTLGNAVGYVTIKLNGSNVKIPYYNV